MKKAILIFALAASVVFSAFGVSAQDYYPSKGDDGNYSYTVKVDLKKILDNPDDPELSYGSSMYGLVAVLGTDNAKIEDGNIVYIDQATSTEDGMLVFSGFLPMGPSPDAIEPKQEEGQDQVIPASDGEAGTEPGTGGETGTETDDPATGDPTDVPNTDDPADDPVDDPAVVPEYFKECTLFIGGPGFEGAKEIGVLKDASAVAVTCNVKDSDQRTGVAFVTVKDSNGEIVVDSFESSVSSGAFTVDMPTGTGYTFEFTKTNYCKYIIEGVDVSGNVELPVADLTTLAGNADGLAGVDFYDLDAVLGNYGAASSKYDTTGDGGINFYDLDAVLGNYGRPEFVYHQD